MQIYIAQAGEQTGPFSESQVESMLNSGAITAENRAWHEGLADWQPLHQVLNLAPMAMQPPPFPQDGLAPADAQAMYLYIPTTRLIVMSIVSLGLYEAYWIYRNWRYLKERDGRTDIMPFWRGIFGIFFIHSLLTEIHNDRMANRIAPANFSPGPLATGWVVLILIGRLLGRLPSMALNTVGIFVTLPSFAFLLPAQQYINEVNEASGVRLPYYRFSGGHITCLIIGIIAWFVILSAWFS